MELLDGTVGGRLLRTLDDKDALVEVEAGIDDEISSLLHSAVHDAWDNDRDSYHDIEEVLDDGKDGGIFLEDDVHTCGEDRCRVNGRSHLQYHPLVFDDYCFRLEETLAGVSEAQ